MKLNKKILQNGLRIITVPMKDNPTVTVLIMVEAGSKYETKQIGGVSHFLEHLCFKGTKRRPSALILASELDGLGAKYNAFTSNEFTGFFAKSQSKNLGKILDVVSDLYLNPVFSESEIEKEKGVILEEIRMYEDIPMHKIQELFLELLYGDQPAGWSVAGTEKTVKNLKQEDILNYRASHYISKATTIVVAGSINEKKVIKEIEEIFKNIKVGKKGEKVKIVENQKKPQVFIKHKKIDQTHFILGTRTFGIHSYDVPAMNVLATLLGGGMSSRLFQKLRNEMGVAYYVKASNNFFTDHGFFEVSSGIDTMRIKEVIAAVLEEFKKLKEIPVDKKELSKTKEFIIGNFLLELESSNDLAEYYGLQEILRTTILSPSEYIKKIQNISGKDVQRIARKIFDSKTLNLTLLGNIEKEEEMKTTLLQLLSRGV